MDYSRTFTLTLAKPGSDNNEAPGLSIFFLSMHTVYVVVINPQLWRCKVRKLLNNPIVETREKIIYSCDKKYGFSNLLGRVDIVFHFNHNNKATDFSDIA